MEALVWEAPRRMVMGDWAEPSAAPGEVVIAVAFAGICGSDLGGYLGHNALRIPPLVMGHEFSGTIVSVGDGVPDRLKAGQSVTCNPMLSCGACAHCRAGLPHLCTHRSLIGAHRPGAFAARVAAPAEAVFALPDTVGLREGALIEPVAVGMRIGKLAGNLSGKSALVIGAGPIGLLALQALRLRGATTIVVSDIDPARLAMAGELGAEVIDARSDDLMARVRSITGGLGVDMTVDAVGSAETRTQAVAATRSAGLVLLSGLHEEASAFPASEVIRREISVKGAFCYSREDFAAGIDAVAAGTMRLDPWVVEAPLRDGGAWFDRLADRPGNVSKVLLVP
jgi:threonine dehydrogenase-like Zn-dependent dehydrogenase